MEKLEIVTGVSRNFFNPLSVMLTSLVYNNLNNIIVFNILHDDFIEEDILKFESLFAKYQNLEIKFHYVSDELVKDLPLLQHFKISTYFRILAPSIFKEKDKLLYLDADIIVDGDILELWNTDITAYILAAVREESITALDKRLKMPKNYKYFNAGIVLLNAKKIRAEHKFEEVIKYLKDYRDEILYLDQDALNAVLFDEWLEIDEKWNYHNTFVLKRGMKSENVSIDEPVIIHYTGPLKPWHAESDHVLRHKYQKYENIFNGTSEMKLNTNGNKNFFKKVVKKLYNRMKKNRLMLVLNKKIKQNKVMKNIYFKLKAKFSPSQQVMKSFESKAIKKRISILESNIEVHISNYREHTDYLQIEGFAFKRNFSDRKTKKYFILENLNNGEKIVYTLNEVDILDLNNIYYDNNDYSRSGFFNFINKTNLKKGIYEAGFLLEKKDVLHYKRVNLKIII